LAVALAVGGVLATAPARAGYLMDFSGNTAPQSLTFSPPLMNFVGVNSTINFAVLDLSGNNATDPWETGYTMNGGIAKAFMPGSGSKMKTLDTTAQYLYLYQVSNTQPASIKNQLITSVTLQLRKVDAVNITSLGYFTGLGLSDASGPASATNSFGKATVPGNPAIANVGVTMPSVVAISGITPSSVALIPGTGNVVNFTASWPKNGGTLASQDTSLLFGFTSSEGPMMLKDVVASPAVAGVVAGTAPGPFNPFAGVPEPPSLTLTLIGVALVSVFRVGRRVRCRGVGWLACSRFREHGVPQRSCRPRTLRG
jgi:hypothetical protein